MCQTTTLYLFALHADLGLEISALAVVTYTIVAKAPARAACVGSLDWRRKGARETLIIRLSTASSRPGSHGAPKQLACMQIM